MRLRRTDVLVRDNIQPHLGRCASCGGEVACPEGPMAYADVMGAQQPVCTECLRDASPQLGDMYQRWDGAMGGAGAGAGAMGAGRASGSGWGPSRAFDPTS